MCNDEETNKGKEGKEALARAAFFVSFVLDGRRMRGTRSGRMDMGTYVERFVLRRREGGCKRTSVRE